MSQDLTIVCIGKATQDVFLSSKIAFAPHVGLDGKQYEELPLGSKLDVDDVVFSTGGNASNASVTFARQGLHSVYVWNLGDEISSHAILKDMDDNGVDTSLVKQEKTLRTSYSTILLAPNGERTILNYHGSVPRGDASDLNLDKIEKIDWLYVSALGDIEILSSIISNLKSKNPKVLLNPAGSELANIDKLRTILEEVEIIVVNKEEAQKIVEGQSLIELARHLNNYCPVALVTDGPNGSVVSDRKQVLSAGMYEDIPVVDRTGGGDAFASGFLARYAMGKGIEEALTFASANSTSVVSQIGAKAGILHSDAIIHQMQIIKELY